MGLGFRKLSTASKYKRVVTSDNCVLDRQLRGVKADRHQFRVTHAKEVAANEAARKASIARTVQHHRAEAQASQWEDVPMAPMDDYDMGPGDSSFDFVEERLKQSGDDAYADRQDQYIQQRLSSVPKGKRKQYALSMIVWTN
ncbi:hypothetical protein B9479_007128, partial [Cryptococcus floricola]